MSEARIIPIYYYSQLLSPVRLPLLIEHGILQS